MTFEEYCAKKKIDPVRFKKDDPKQWEELAGIFEQVSENSFTQQKKFLINDLRRKYPLKETESLQRTNVSGPAPSPKIKPAIKIK